MLQFPFICRLCLIPNQLNSFVQIFDDTSEIPVKILELTNIKVESEDGLPQHVCLLCRAHLELSVTFRRQVQKADSMLRHHLEQKLITKDKYDSDSEDMILRDLFLKERIEIPLEEDNIEVTEEDKEADSGSSRWEDVSVKSKNDSDSEDMIPKDLFLKERVEIPLEEDNIEVTEEDKEADSIPSNREDNSVKNKDDTNTDSMTAKDPLSEERVEVLQEEDNLKNLEVTEEDKEADSGSPHWEDISVKVENNIVVAEPWPAPEPEDGNCLHDDIEETLGENNSNEKSLLEVSVSKIKEEKEPHLPTDDKESMSSESEDEETLSELKLKLTWTDSIKCSCQFCSENKINSLLENDDNHENQLNCLRCFESFETVELLKKHLKLHRKSSSKKYLECRRCGKSFTSRKVLYAHQRQHRNKQTLEHTKFIKSEEQQEQQAIQTQPNEQIDNVRRSSRPSRAPERHVVPHYSCSKCERMYSDRAALENHEKSHLGKPSLKCNHCGKKYFSKDCLEKHISSAHISKLRIKNHEHQCNICGKKCENRSHLFSHMRSHNSTVHLCEICGKTVSLNAYAAHKRSHLDSISEEVFQCDVCQKKFNSKVSLRSHKVSYHGPLKFTCEICGKQFTTMALMKHHQNTHSGKRDHVCQVCGRAFTLKITLKSHMRIHTGEMPYKCDKCGRQFTWKTTYRNHVSSCKIDKMNFDSKPQIGIPHYNSQYVPLNMPQESPIDYSEEGKYQVPLDYREEVRYRHIIPSESNSFPIVLHFNEQLKYASQQAINYSSDIKPFS